MAQLEKDEVKMMAEISNVVEDSELRRRVSRTPNASISIPIASLKSYEGTASPTAIGNIAESTNIFPTLDGAHENDWDKDFDIKHKYLSRSEKLVMCNDPYCSTCPTYLKPSRKPSTKVHPKFNNNHCGDDKGFGRKLIYFVSSYVPGVMNPHAKVVQQWNRILALFCLVAIFVDPLFLFLIYVKKDDKCIAINRTMRTPLVLVRSINDLIYLSNILLQFRLAYVCPGSRVLGADDLVDHPKKIALNYLKSYFLVDLFIVLPLPQIIILFVLPKFMGFSGANYSKNLLRAMMLAQHFPRLFRFLQIVRSTTAFILEQALAKDIKNLLIFMLSGHAVGSCWYLFGLQRVNQCLRDACHNSDITDCLVFIDCGHAFGEKLDMWKNNTNAAACLNANSGAFSYGIYEEAVPLTVETKVIEKYVFALFWGYKQVITLADNLSPTYFVWEVLFAMAIMILGLCFFALFIGNIQSYLHTLRHRRLEMELRGCDVEQWLSHRRIPEDLRRYCVTSHVIVKIVSAMYRRVRMAERYNWAATRGVNEEMLMESLPEDLQTDIRRHLFKFVKKVRVFSLMDEPILDAICDRLKPKAYMKGSRILTQSGFVEKMVFVMRGKLESFGGDGTRVTLSDGDVCGEELLTWYIERVSISTDDQKVRLPRQRLISNRTVKCLTNVEVFSLRLADLEDLTILFAGSMHNPRVQGAMRYGSLYWRPLVAKRIQVAWRNRKKRRTSESN